VGVDLRPEAASRRQTAAEGAARGGAGAGITLTPVAVLAIHEGEVKLLQVDPFNSTADRVVGMVPDVVDKISGLFSKKDKKKKEQPEEKPAKSSIDDIDLSDPLV